MSSFALEIWDDEAEKAAFYTVRWEDSEISETDKFFEKMNKIPEMKPHAQELAKLIIEIIGNTYGAHPAFFNRFENRVTALPPQGHVKLSELALDYEGFPLRLYCLAFSEELVILFNGGIKNARTVQESTDSISIKFMEANDFAKKIFVAMNQRLILMEGRTLITFNGSSEIYL